MKITRFYIIFFSVLIPYNKNFDKIWLEKVNIDYYTWSTDSIEDFYCGSSVIAWDKSQAPSQICCCQVLKKQIEHLLCKKAKSNAPKKSNTSMDKPGTTEISFQKAIWMKGISSHIFRVMGKLFLFYTLA